MFEAKSRIKRVELGIVKYRNTYLNIRFDFKEILLVIRFFVEH